MQFALKTKFSISKWRRILALDLYDLRTLVREYPRGHRTRYDPGKIENADPFKRQSHCQIRPSPAKAAASADSIPRSSRRISAVCSPTSGGRRYTHHGVPLKT